MEFKNVKTNLVLLILFIFQYSCKEKPLFEYYENGSISKEYFKNEGNYEGIYKEYYLNGNLKIKKNFIKGIEKDSSIFYYNDSNKKIEHINYHHTFDSIRKIYYYESGNKSREGYANQKGIAFGKWNIYNKNKSLESIKEFKNIKGKEYLNQVWSLNSYLKR